MMKTLSEYHKFEQKLRNLKNKAGVLCDKCRTELIYSNPGVMLMSNPPQSDVECPNCGLKSRKTEYGRV